ncbi:MAG: LysR family transcriptional regulator [Bacilli bacterium]
MDIRQLEYFVAVADRQSVTRGAAALYVSQPTVSQQIRLLEAELGQPLFERRVSGVLLTDAGRTLLRYALRILQNRQEAIAEIRGDREREGTIEIGVLPTMSWDILPKLMGAYRLVEPGHQIAVTEASTQTLLRAVSTGDAEMALLDLPIADPTLHVEKLWTEELIVIAPPGSAEFSARPGPLTQLRDALFITAEPGYGLRDVLFRLTQTAGFNPRVAFELTSLGAIIGFVHHGFGLSLVPERTVRLEIQAGEIQPVALQEPVSRDIGLVWRNNRPLAPAARAFAAFCREELVAP